MGRWAVGLLDCWAMLCLSGGVFFLLRPATYFFDEGMQYGRGFFHSANDGGGGLTFVALEACAILVALDARQEVSSTSAK